MDNEPKEELKDALADLFSNVPDEKWETIPVPSGGTIKMRAMSFDDEKALAQLSASNNSFLTQYINNCVDMDVNELYIVDKLFLISRLRSISFGPEYTAECICPKCSSTNSVTINLDDLAVGKDEDFSGIAEVLLPKMDKVAKVVLPKIKDEDFFNSADTMHANLWRFVKQIDEYTSGPLIAEAIKKMPITDVHAILRAIQPEEIGLQTQIMLDCNDCNKQSVLDLPINEGFFIVK